VAAAGTITRARKDMFSIAKAMCLLSWNRTTTDEDFLVITIPTINITAM